MRVLRITGSTTIGASATTLTWGRDNGASYLDLDPHRVRQVVLRLAVATANLTSLKIYAKAHASDSKWIPLATAAADYTGGANIYVKDSRVYNDGDDSYVDAAAYTTNADDYAVLVLVNPGYVQLKITAEGSGAVVSAYAAGFDSDVDLSTPHLTIHATVNNDVGLLDSSEAEINPATSDAQAALLTEIGSGTPGTGNASADSDGAVREQLKYTNDKLDAIASDLAALNDGATAVVPVKGSKAVTAAGTSEPLVAAQTFASYVAVQAKKAGAANVGVVYLKWDSSSGDLSSDHFAALSGNDYWSKTARLGEKFDLNKLYVDVANSADGLVFEYDPAQ